MGEAAGLSDDALDLYQQRLQMIRAVIEVSGRTSAEPFPKTVAAFAWFDWGTGLESLCAGGRYWD
jgi:hypothetical protein